MTLKHEGFKGQLRLVLPKSVVDKIRKNLLIKDLFITDIGFYPNAENHFRERRKGTSGNIIIYCVDGFGYYEAKGEVVNIKKHDVLVIPANVPHKYGANPENPWTIYWMHVEGEKANLISGKIPHIIHLNNEIPDLYLNRIHMFDDIFNKISIYYNHKNIEYANLMVSNFLATIFYQDLYLWKSDNSGEKLIDRSLDFMRKSVHKNLTLHDLSAHSELSVSQYSNIFKQKTSTSPMLFYIHLKVQKSCQLMENPAKRIKEIALDLGFEDQFYFSRVFKKVMGLSPARFKKNLQG